MHSDCKITLYFDITILFCKIKVSSLSKLPVITGYTGVSPAADSTSAHSIFLAYYVPTGRLVGGNLHFYRYFIPNGTNDNLLKKTVFFEFRSIFATFVGFFTAKNI